VPFLFGGNLIPPTGRESQPQTSLEAGHETHARHEHNAGRGSKAGRKPEARHEHPLQRPEAILQAIETAGAEPAIEARLEAIFEAVGKHPVKARIEKPSVEAGCKPESGCEPIGCEPVACEPVRREPVECEPVGCEPVGCKAKAGREKLPGVRVDPGLHSWVERANGAASPALGMNLPGGREHPDEG
jgi:hypothetical protein